jgi:hypothetical protein
MDQLHNGEPGNAFATSRLTDHPKHPPTRNIEADPVERTHLTDIGVERNFEVFDANDIVLRHL